MICSLSLQSESLLIVSIHAHEYPDTRVIAHCHNIWQSWSAHCHNTIFSVFQMFYLENVKMLWSVFCFWCIVEMLVIFSCNTETTSLSNEQKEDSWFLTKMKLVWLVSQFSVIHYCCYPILAKCHSHTTKSFIHHLIHSTFLPEKSQFCLPV